MKVQVTVDGNTEEHDIRLNELTLREGVELQKLIGNDSWDAYVSGHLRPDAIRGLIEIKLRAVLGPAASFAFDAQLVGNPPAEDGPGDPT